MREEFWGNLTRFSLVILGSTNGMIQDSWVVKSTFRFYNMWYEHLDFYNIIESLQKNHMTGRVMLQVYQIEVIKENWEEAEMGMIRP